MKGLDDPFGPHLRSGKPFTLTLRQVLGAVDTMAGTTAALPNQLVFLAADGDQKAAEKTRLENQITTANTELTGTVYSESFLRA